MPAATRGLRRAPLFALGWATPRTSSRAGLCGSTAAFVVSLPPLQSRSQLSVLCGQKPQNQASVAGGSLPGTATPLRQAHPRLSAPRRSPQAGTAGRVTRRANGKKRRATGKKRTTSALSPYSGIFYV